MQETVNENEHKLMIIDYFLNIFPLPLFLTSSIGEFLGFRNWCFLKYLHLNREQNCENFCLLAQAGELVFSDLMSGQQVCFPTDALYWVMYLCPEMRVVSLGYCSRKSYERIYVQ